MDRTNEAEPQLSKVITFRVAPEMAEEIRRRAGGPRKVGGFLRGLVLERLPQPERRAA